MNLNIIVMYVYLALATALALCATARATCPFQVENDQALTKSALAVTVVEGSPLEHGRISQASVRFAATESNASNAFVAHVRVEFIVRDDLVGFKSLNFTHDFNVSGTCTSVNDDATEVYLDFEPDQNVPVGADDYLLTFTPGTWVYDIQRDELLFIGVWKSNLVVDTGVATSFRTNSNEPNVFECTRPPKGAWFAQPSFGFPRPQMTTAISLGPTSWIAEGSWFNTTIVVLNDDLVARCVVYGNERLITQTGADNTYSWLGVSVPGRGVAAVRLAHVNDGVQSKPPLVPVARSWFAQTSSPDVWNRVFVQSHYLGQKPKYMSYSVDFTQMQSDEVPENVANAPKTFAVGRVYEADAFGVLQSRSVDDKEVVVADALVVAPVWAAHRSLVVSYAWESGEIMFFGAQTWDGTFVPMTAIADQDPAVVDSSSTFSLVGLKTSTFNFQILLNSGFEASGTTFIDSGPAPGPASSDVGVVLSVVFSLLLVLFVVAVVVIANTTKPKNVLT